MEGFLAIATVFVRLLPEFMRLVRSIAREREIRDLENRISNIRQEFRRVHASANHTERMRNDGYRRD